MARPRGRPPLDDEEDSIPVHVKMTATEYDETYRRVQRERVSVPEQIRRDARAGRARRNEEVGGR